MRSLPRGCTRWWGGASPPLSWPSGWGWRPPSRRCESPTRSRASNRSYARRCSARCWRSPPATVRAERTRCGSLSRAPSTCRSPAPACHASPNACWRSQQPPPGDFFVAKAILAALLDALRVPWRVERAAKPFLHPGRAAVVLAPGGEGDDGERTLTPVGWLGELHPLVAARWELEGAPVAAFELELDALPEPTVARYRDLTSFPEVREDLAVVVSEQISAGQVLEVVREAGRPPLVAAGVFDGHRDPEPVGAGNGSLALRLAFRAEDRTLTDAEVAALRASIGAALERRLGGRIRGG